MDKIKQKHCNVLHAIQQDLINKDTSFQYVKNPEDSINKDDGIFIWVGARNGYIGHDYCHYEIIFNDDKSEEISVEVHFAENKNDKNELFDNIVKKHKKLQLKEDWPYDNGFRRIVYKETVSILAETNKDIIKKTLKILEDLDARIGDDLVQFVKQSKWNDNIKQYLTKLSKKNGALSAGIRKAPKQVNHSNEKYTCAHNAVEKALKKALERKYNDIDGNRNIVLTERKLGNIKPDILVYTNKKYDIYEVKAYKDPVDCIDEALGQILVYSYMLSSNNPKYSVNKLYIVGPNKADSKTRGLLCHIKQKYGLTNLSYITPEEIK